MPHLDEGQLTLLLDDELDGTDRSAAEAHLQGCADCRRLLEETRGFMQEAERLVASVDLPPRKAPTPAPGTTAPTAPPLPTTGRPLPWRSLAWAATVVLAAGLGWFASDSRFHPPELTLTDAVTAGRVGEGAPEQRAVPAKSGMAGPQVRIQSGCSS